uniref:DDE Tnp4 domain-containing protein n=1 Tax=Erpetoichthys calabaricus TaxID=27687 RepID=A0A8C4SL89_ERPCA
MSPLKFDDLLHRIKHRSMQIDPIGAAVCLAVTLHHLATDISLQALAASYKFGQETVSNIMAKVCQTIWTALKEELVAFPDTEQWEKIKWDFWHFWNYQNCLGAIDVRVRAPCSSGNTYSLSKFGSQLIQGNLSLLLLSTLPGSKVLSSPVFITDEAFPLKDILIHCGPPGPEFDTPGTYNYRHSRARWVVENAFGILAARWRIFGKTMECSVDKAQDITKACIALDNYLCTGDSMDRPLTYDRPDIQYEQLDLRPKFLF